MKQHYYYFDFARVIAAILVLLVHARVEILTPYSMLPVESKTLLTKMFFAICSLGTDGVIVFFILSGFLVGGRNLEKIIHGQGSAKHFAVNRLCRIFPPLLLALLFSTVQKYITGDPIDGLNIGGNLLCLQGIVVSPEMPVLWTIAYEMFFYLLILALFLLRKRASVIAGIILLFLSLTAALSLRIYFWFPIVIGTLFFFCRAQLNGKYVAAIVATVLGFLALAGEKLINDSSVVRIQIGFISYDVVILLESLSWAMVLVVLSMQCPQGVISEWIETTGNKWSKFSYSLFLCHYPVLRLCRYAIGHPLSVDVSGISCMMLVCLFCCVVAIVFYHLSEKHSHRLECFVLDLFKS